MLESIGESGCDRAGFLTKEYLFDPIAIAPSFPFDGFGYRQFAHIEAIVKFKTSISRDGSREYPKKENISTTYRQKTSYSARCDVVGGSSLGLLHSARLEPFDRLDVLIIYCDCKFLKDLFHIIQYVRF